MIRVYLAVFSILTLFGINIFLAVNNSSDFVIQERYAYSANDSGGEVYILPISGPNYVPILNSEINRPFINARAAAIYDTSSGRLLYEKNIDSRLPIASLAKVMSAVIVLENLNLEDIVTIGESSLKIDGEKQDLYLGERMSVRNLLKLMLIESSNDSAHAVASYADELGYDFVSLMNKKAEVIKMKETRFLDPAGLNDEAYSTVQDLIKLVEYSLNYKEIWDISAEKTAIIESSDKNIKHSAQSTNLLLGLIKGLVGGKTGYTDGAGQCMILVAGVPDYPSKLVSVVLGSSDRFGDTQKLIDWTRGAYSWR